MEGGGPGPFAPAGNFSAAFLFTCGSSLSQMAYVAAAKRTPFGAFGGS